MNSLEQFWWFMFLYGRMRFSFFFFFWETKNFRMLNFESSWSKFFFFSQYLQANCGSTSFSWICANSQLGLKICNLCHWLWFIAFFFFLTRSFYFYGPWYLESFYIWKMEEKKFGLYIWWCVKKILYKNFYTRNSGKIILVYYCVKNGTIIRKLSNMS